MLIGQLEQRHGIPFEAYFDDALRALQPLIADSLVERGADGLRVLAPGRLLLRNIAMGFDRYLDQPVAHQPARFSRAI